MEKLILCKIFPCDIFSVTLPDNHLKQLINLLYNDVKNLSSILKCYIDPNCAASINDAKPISLCDNQLFACFCNSIMKINSGQTIKLFYTDVKNLTSILRCSKGISAWKVQIPLSVQDNRLLHIFSIFT